MNKSRPSAASTALLAVVLLCSLAMHATTPDALPLAATPAPTLAASPLPAPEITIAPTPVPTPTADPQATPILLGEGQSTLASVGTSVFSIQAPSALADETPATASPEPTQAPQEPERTFPPLPAATSALISLHPDLSSPRISDPTYTYETDTLKIEITEHEIENVVYFAVELWLTDVSQLRSAFSGDHFDSPTESVSDIAQRNAALVAINGDFATFNNGGIIIRNSELFRANNSSRQLLVIDRNGDFIPYIDPPDNPQEAAEHFLSEGVLHTLVFGPVLIENGERVPLPEKFFLNTRALEPRTAIAQLGPLHYLFLVVDGRQDGYSQGVSMERLQDLFLEHGAQTAFNLDGGGSATLCFYGNVINQPANGGQRRVPDILYIVD